MAIPILRNWKNYYENPDEGLGSSYERVIINAKLERIINRFKINSILESPSFGFTGVSGINSMNLAKMGLRVTLTDHDEARIQLINKTWKEMNIPLKTVFLKEYSFLPFNDEEFEMSWNFSALWFVEDLFQYLSELTRVTSKVILLCVPNRFGVGYLSQKYTGKDDLKKYLKEENILPRNFIIIMKRLKWQLVENNFIDCPPWPDIGMPKKKFLQKFGLGYLIKESADPVNPLSILDYYSEEDLEFEDKMMKYSLFEKYAPNFFKRFWAHHQFFIFQKTE
ncbi:MAG: methyltransferase domain-containing protein [Candidatus Cloacimonetes bacterium]|nr:methyltransferase domain-containing protein [Candidatus Cloacimonadota bacterium]